MDIKLPNSVVSSVVENAPLEYTDNDMNRDERDKLEDSICGELGEIIVNKYLTRNGFSISESSTPKSDLLINSSPAEVKARKTWNYSKPDLLVRTKFDLASDVYIQVDLHTTNNNRLKKDGSNFSHGTVLGFVPKEKVEEYGQPFNQGYSAKKNSTLMVKRNKLLDMNKLNNYL